MSFSGTLASWSDERGFGFIAPTHGGAEIFVHISAFPGDGTRPTVGEKLTYDVERGREGKPQAVRIIRQAVGSDRPRRLAGGKTESSKSNWLGALALVGVVAIGGTWVFKQFTARQYRMELAAQPPTAAANLPARSTTAAAFTCDGRTHCSQMTSCAEATWFINHCPGTKMDGNNDGVPCEQQWCN